MVIDVTAARGNKKIKTDSKKLNMLISVNGENKFIPQGISILKLLESLKINSKRVVIELNNEIIKQSDFEKVILQEKDKLEIVTFVGGG